MGAAGASSLSERQAAAAAIWWRISVFQYHVMLHVTTGLSTWHSHFFFFFTRGFTKCKFPPNPPPPLGARKPSSYTPGTGLGSPSGSRRNPGPSTPARRALLTAPAAGGPEGSVTEPGSHLPGLFPPRFSEPRATQLSSPQGRQSKFLRGSEEHWLSALLPPFPCLPPPHTSGLGGREVSSVLTRDHPTTVFPQGVPGSGPP